MDGYLTTQQAAEKLDVTQGRIRQMILDGTITGVQKFGQMNMIPAGEISRLKRKKRPPGRPRKSTK